MPLSVTGPLVGTIHIIRLVDGAPVAFHADGERARFLRDGHSIVYIVNGGHDIVRQDFLSGAGAPIQVLIPASQDFITDSFQITPDGKHITAAYAQPSRSLVVADDVPGIKK